MPTILQPPYYLLLRHQRKAYLAIVLQQYDTYEPKKLVIYRVYSGTNVFDSIFSPSKLIKTHFPHPPPQFPFFYSIQHFATSIAAPYEGIETKLFVLLEQEQQICLQEILAGTVQQMLHPRFSMNIVSCIVEQMANHFLQQRDEQILDMGNIFQTKPSTRQVFVVEDEDSTSDTSDEK